MAKKKTQIPKYGTITLKGIQYYRTRITDADGKELSLYAATCEELYRMTIVRVLGSKFLLYHFGIKAVIILKYHGDTN